MDKDIDITKLFFFSFKTLVDGLKPNGKSLVYFHSIFFTLGDMSINGVLPQIPPMSKYELGELYEEYGREAV